MRAASKLGDSDASTTIKNLLGDEKSLINRQKREQAEYDSIKKLKEINKERALQGKQPHFAKKRELKES